MPRPFLRWVGGKRWLVGEVARLAGKGGYSRYVEPFLGGGAVFFGLGLSNAVLGDRNEELMNVYAQVRDRPEQLIRQLKKLEVSRESFGAVRQDRPKGAVGRAVRFLYLNRTAFSGLYRVNMRGEYNVPYGGGRRTPEVLWKRRLLEGASEALQGVELVSGDFEKTVDACREGDLVYCDPTYAGERPRERFDRYNAEKFTWRDQERLARSCRLLAERGCTVIVSNCADSSVLELYSPHEFVVVERLCRVSANVRHRTRVNEVLMAFRPKGRTGR